MSNKELCNNELRGKLDELSNKRKLKAELKSKNKKVTYQEVSRTADAVTGELLSEQIETKFATQPKAEPSFIKLYIDDLVLINDLPTSTSNILWELVKRISYDNQIILNSSLKKRICADLDIKMQTLNNALTKFVKKQILYRVEPGIFMPNPYLFAKGGWDDVKELRMIIDYSSGKRHIQGEVNGEVAATLKDISEE